MLGPSVSKIVPYLSRDLARLALLAKLVAWPTAWYLLQWWLQGSLYRAPIRFDILIAAGMTAFIIALLTIGGQSSRAARANPVDSLRYE